MYYPELRGTGAVEAAVGRDGDAVIALGRRARDQLVGDIERHPRGIALGWVAKAAAAR